MRGFIVDETYRIEDNGVNVYLFGRLENGESFCAISAFAPYFCIRKEDQENATKLNGGIPIAFEEVDWKSMDEEPLVKVTTKIPKDVAVLRKSFEERKIPCFEADIRFTQRFLIDRNILRSLVIKGDYAKGDTVDRIYREPELAPSDWYPTLRVLSFDIETSMDAKRLLSISLVCRDPGHERSEVLFVGEPKKELKHARIVPDEKAALEAFRDAVIEIDPDIITGWNTIDFDLAVLREMFAKHKVPFRFGRTDWDCALRLESSFFKESVAEVPGRQVLDGIQMLKLNFIQLESYKLGEAAKALVGAQKLIGETGKGKAISDAYRDDPQLLVDYNLKDSELVLDILKATNAVDIMLNRALLTGMPLDRVRGSIASFDSLYLRELRALGYVAPSAHFAEKDEGIKGAYVMDSKPGVYDYVAVCDFKSLYPSLMRTFNIDPLAFARGKRLSAHTRKKHVTSPNGAVFDASETGILPGMLKRLWEARDDAKRRKDTRASFAIKILMNSFFGVLAAPACRFFSLDMANAITAFSREAIKSSMAEITAMGHEVIYGDTDSVFVNTKASSEEEALRIAADIATKITAFQREKIKKGYDRESYLELQAEKVFVHFLMPKVRGSEEGAKKRYAGMVCRDGELKLEATGMEIVRRDWTELAKDFQKELLRLVFAKDPDVERYIKKLVDDLKSGKRDADLIYRKAARKEIEGYTKTTPPHIKAARLLAKAGIEMESNIVEYVMTVDGPYPVQLQEKAPKKLDYDSYIEKQIRPIADAILSFYDASFDDMIKGAKQQTLFGY